MGLPLPRVIADVGPGGPIVTSMRGANALRNDMLKNKYYGPNIESEINNKNALTEGQKIENQYMPDKLRLANALADLRNQYYGPNIQSEINNRNALTDQTTTMTPLKAKELELKNEWYPKTEQATIDWKNSGGSGGGVDQKIMQSFKKQISDDNPEFTPQQVNEASSAYISGDSQLKDGTPLPIISGQGQQYLDIMTKKANTAAGLNQQRYAATTDKLLDEGAKLIPSVAKYAGALGKAQGKIDAARSSLGADSPEYKDYLKFTRITAPTAAGEMMRALGVNASDKQKEIYMSVMDPTFWDSNPKTAMENYKYMQKMFKETISKTVGQSLSETKNQLRGGGTKAEDNFEYVDYDKPPGSVGMIDPDGNLHFIPNGEVEAYRKRKYKYAKSG